VKKPIAIAGGRIEVGESVTFSCTKRGKVFATSKGFVRLSTKQIETYLTA
jgi:hypothetical protein